MFQLDDCGNFGWVDSLSTNAGHNLNDREQMSTDVAVHFVIGAKQSNRSGDPAQPTGANPVDPLFVFLHLLKGHAHFVGELSLRHPAYQPLSTDQPTNSNVVVVRRFDA